MTLGASATLGAKLDTKKALNSNRTTKIAEADYD